MFKYLRIPLLSAALVGAAALAAHAQAGGDPSGVWYDNTGRGAVEISDCGGRLCGKLVWVSSASNSKGCGMQIIGNAKPMGNGTWDKGWIYSPDEDAKYDVEITPLASGKLKVVGYAGSKMLSETMIWTRAPQDLKRCQA